MRALRWLLIFAVAVLIFGPRAVRADSVVTLCQSDTQPGPGTNLAAALAAGGLISFQCGGPTTIVVTGEYQLAADTEIDGGGMTLDFRGERSGLFGANTGPRSSLRLRNLTLTNGSAANCAPLCRGIVNGTVSLELSSVTVRDSTVPIGIVGGPLLVADSVLSGNAGGAVVVMFASGCQVDIRRSRFINNSGELGSALRTYCDATIEKTLFSANRASASGGAIYLGHPFFGNPFLPPENTEQTITMHSVTLTANTAGGAGGAIAVQSGPASRKLELRYSTFTDNRAASGGAIDLGVPAPLPGSPGATDIVFSGAALLLSNNSAATRGGAINVSGQAAIALARARIVGNRAGQSGGAVHLGQAIAGRLSEFGNVLLVQNEAPQGAGFTGSATRFVNSTIARNIGGAAVSLAGGSAPGVSWKNTIVAHNLGGNCQGQGGIDAGNNLQFPNADCGGSILVADPRMDSRFLPVSPSLALGHGDPVVCRNSPVYGRDVYGQRRNDQCAIGAAEADLQHIIYPNGPPPPPSGGGTGGGCNCGGGYDGEHDHRGHDYREKRPYR